MKTLIAHSLLRRGVVSLLLVALAPGLVAAQDSQLEKILERLDRIEKENRELRKTVQSQQEQLQQLQGTRPEALPAPEPSKKTDSGSTGKPGGKDGEGGKKPADTSAKPKEGDSRGKDGESKGKDADKANPSVRSWDVGSDLKMEGTWNNGLPFETKDKAFRLAVGGVIQFDMGWFNASDPVKESIGRFNNLVDPGQTLQDGMGFRRARLRMSGIAFEQLEYFAQYEFANAFDLRQRTLGIPNRAGVADPVASNFDPNETVGFNEVYLGLVKVPCLGTVRVGRHRESLNFVTATQDTFQIWMERGLLFDAFNGNYNFSNGVTVSNTYFNDRAYTLFGFFEQNNNNNRQFYNVGDGNYVYDGRVTFLPVYSEEDQVWVHLGLDYSYRNLYQDNVRYRARPDLRIGPSFQSPSIVDSGTIFSPDAQQIANLELAAACGPWTFAAEATTSWVTNAFTGGLPLPNGQLPRGVVRRGTYRAEGCYVELLRFLTPDHRPYRKERPGYARVIPKNNFFLLQGDDGKVVSNWGAWEVGVRYDYVDLSHGGINGGSAHGLTGAVNWYLSSNTRVQANYIWMERSFAPPDNSGRGNGDFSGFGIRFNCDF